MRVLTLHNHYRQAGGEDSVVETQIAMLRDAGHDVVLDEVQNPGSAAAAARALAASSWSAAQAHRVLGVAKALKPDVVHVHNTWFTLTPAVVRALSAAGFPVVVSLHNYRLLCVNASLFREDATCTDCIGHLPWRGVTRGCYHGSRLQSAGVAAGIALHRGLHTWSEVPDVLTAPSEFARQQFVATGLPAERLVVAPNPVPDPGPRHAPPSRSDVVLYAGRLSREKGLPNLLEAWRAGAPPGLKLVLVGDGELADWCGRISPSVEVHPWLDSERLRQKMLSARAVVAPTRMLETFGLLAVEAMAAGAAVLVSGGGALSEAVGDAGPKPVPVGTDAADWHTALLGLGDDALVDRWGLSGRARYEEQFALPGVLARTLDIYALATSRRSRRRRLRRAS